MKNQSFPSPLAGISLVLSALVLTTGSLRAANSIDALRERERKVEAVVEKVMGATVAIMGEKSAASGSGVIVNKEGLILSAGHVTEAAGENLIIIFPDGKQVKAKSLGANRSRDAAMAQITDAGEYPFVELGNSKDLALGAWCVALGHPGGYDSRRTPPVRLGRVWSKKTMWMLGSDCTLVGGDSGGPLFDLDGKLIGIHSSIGGSLEENRHVPVEVFREDWDRMLAGEVVGSIGFLSSRLQPDQPMLGVQLEEATDEKGGALIAGIMGNSPAAKSGLKIGDRVLAIDGKEIATRDELMEIVKGRKAGDELTMTIEREGKPEEIAVELAAAETIDFGNPFGGQRPPRQGKKKQDDATPEEPESAPAGKALLGVQIDQNAERAEVAEMIAGSAAEKAGLQPGDVILGIGDTAISDPKSMIDAVGSLAPGDTVDIRLRRNEEAMTLKVTLGEDKD